MADIHHTLAPRTMVMPSGCIEWAGSRMKDGYGRLRIGNKKQLAHRLSYELSIGPIPDQLCVLHRCDNPPCINPDHLFIGTHVDNMQDMKNKGRSRGAVGQANTKNKLTPEQVLKIREDKRGKSAIALEYGIHPGSVCNIRLRKCWKHLP